LSLCGRPAVLGGRARPADHAAPTWWRPRVRRLLAAGTAGPPPTERDRERANGGHGRTGVSCVDMRAPRGPRVGHEGVGRWVAQHGAGVRVSVPVASLPRKSTRRLAVLQCGNTGTVGPRPLGRSVKLDKMRLGRGASEGHQGQRLPLISRWRWAFVLTAEPLLAFISVQ